MSVVNQQFYYKNNRLQQLRGFCYAAQFGNITRAAELMGISHSSVSLQIKALEDDLGIRLFRRNGPRIKLTQDGARLLELALPHIDGIQQLHETFHHDLRHAKKTELHICVNSTTLNFILPPLIERYMEAHPDIYVTIHFAEQEEAVEKLERGEADFALLPRREHRPFPKTCKYIPVFYYTPALITCADHPLAGRKNLTVQEISGYNLTLPAEELRVIPNLYEVFPQHGIQKKLRINFANLETGRRFIETGRVITISSTVWIRDDDMLAATPLTHLFPMVDYGFIIPRGKQVPEKTHSFIETAKHYAAKKN